MLRPALGLALLLACSCKPEAPPPPPPPPAPPAPPTALELVPDSATTCSVLRRVDNGCSWQRLDVITGQSQTLLTLPADAEGTCRSVRTMLSPDGRRGAALRLVPRAPAASADEHSTSPIDLDVLAYDLTTGQLSPLPPVPTETERDGRLIEGGLREDGRAVLVTAKQYEFDGDWPKSLPFEGRDYPLPDVIHGFAALAQVFVLDQGKWKQVETKVIDDGPFSAKGAPTLTSFQGIGPRQGFGRDDGEPNTRVPAKQVPAGLKPHAERCAPEGWARLAYAPDLYVGFLGEDSDLDAGGCLFAVKDAEVLEFPANPLTPTNTTRWTTRGEFVLGTDLDGGHGALWNTSSHALIHAFGDDTQVQFWPRPGDTRALPVAPPESVVPAKKKGAAPAPSNRKPRD